MLSGILIFNQKGENLIFRAFRNDCRPRLADVFRIQGMYGSSLIGVCSDANGTKS